MDSSARRQIILDKISHSKTRITGNDLAAMLDVTRQVIVQDIAVLRAGGAAIVATPSGYMMIDPLLQTRPVRVFFCRHETLEQAEEELLLIIENGGRIRDVIIEHPVYGEITGTLMVNSTEAVKQLMERLKRKDSMMLSSITDGRHMHTVEACTEEVLDVIEDKLRTAGILM
jgi:transcriptional regulator of NAD metabolism